jgi:hypothetical protein
MDTARGIRSLSILSRTGLLAIVLAGSAPAWAQTAPASGTSPAPGAASPGVGVVVTPPSTPHPPDFGFEPALPPEQGSPREEDYGERTRTIYQPAFLKGAVKTTRTSRTSGIRFGLGGWTAPRIPFDDKDSSGFPAFGLIVEWGTPMEPPAEPAAPAQR